MEDNLDERRLETRLNRQAKVYLETVSALPGEAGGGEVLLCEMLDQSANGVQVEINQPLMVGSILPLYVETAQHDRFCLSAEVRWVRRGERDGSYQIGFLLYDSEETSILEWKKFIAESL